MKNLADLTFSLQTRVIACGFAIIFSCTDDEMRERKMATYDEDFFANYSGTACGVVGALEAAPGETLTYEYKSNIANPEYTWFVDAGSITLTSGQNSSKATFKFGNDFSTGVIRCLEEGDQSCSEVITITKWDPN